MLTDRRRVVLHHTRCGVTAFFQWLVDLIKQFRFTVCVMPWERGIRVRLGNRTRVLDPGWHWCLPIVDVVSLQSTRLRLGGAGPTTISTSDGHILTLSMTIGFSILDPLAAAMRMDKPEMACASLASSIAAGTVSRQIQEYAHRGVHVEERTP